MVNLGVVMLLNSMKTVVLFLLLLFAFANAEFVVARKDNPSREDIELFVNGGYDIASSRVGKYLDIIIAEEELESLKSTSGFYIIDSESQMNLRMTSKTGEERNDAGYMDYDTYISYLEGFQNEYSDIMRIYDIGDSKGKDQGISDYDHDLLLIKISDNVDDNEAEPGYFFAGEHHARETQTFAVTYAILKYLLTNYGTNSKVTDYVDNNQIYLMPLVNPDGYKVARTKNSMWRKNINLNGSTFNSWSSFNTGSQVGVDLNRNYEFQWGAGKSSSVKTNDTYKGPYSHSENEISVIDSLFSVLDIQAAISFHSYSEVILVPFCYSDYARPADYTELNALANKMAVEMKDQYGYNYDVGTAVGLLGYGAGGAMSDHVYANYGVFSYCFELWTSFQTPESSLPSLSSMCVKAATHLLDRSTYSTVKGLVTLNGEPAKAKIEFSGVDDNPGQRTDYYSYEETGQYVRFLSDGSYTLTVTLESNTDSVRVIEGVNVEDDAVTILDVAFGAVDTFEITAPEEGDIYNLGDEYVIAWNNTTTRVVNGVVCDYIDLDLYKDGDKMLTIADSIENEGTYGWVTTNLNPVDTIDSGFTIKITSAIDSSVYDFSEEFLIHNAPTGSVSGLESSNYKLGVNSVTPDMISLSIPAQSDYRVRLYSINGKSLKEWNRKFSPGINKLDLKSINIGKQIALVSISGNGEKLIQKVSLKK